VEWWFLPGQIRQQKKAFVNSGCQWFNIFFSDNFVLIFGQKCPTVKNHERQRIHKEAQKAWIQTQV
jgi:hypothetical protein